MIKRIKKYTRYRDYYYFKAFEVYGAFGISVIFSALLFSCFNFYDNFDMYQDAIGQIICVIIGGEFTLIGMSLAGMAIIVSVFSPDVLRVINKVDKKDTINRVLSQFEFSAFNLAVQIGYLLFIYLLIASDKNKIDQVYFKVIFGVIIYHFFFNLFYIIALIENCIKINEIKNTINKIYEVEKTTVDRANELRIDYILAIVLEEKGISKNDMLKTLYNMIDKTKETNEKELKEYLGRYYR